MERVIQLLHATNAELSEFAWIALGFVLISSFALSLLVVVWICRGGLSVQTAESYLARQREIGLFLRESESEDIGQL
jgi:uncharacterized membrane protein